MATLKDASDSVNDPTGKQGVGSPCTESHLAGLARDTRTGLPAYPFRRRIRHQSVDGRQRRRGIVEHRSSPMGRAHRHSRWARGRDRHRPGGRAARHVFRRQRRSCPRRNLRAVRVQRGAARARAALLCTLGLGCRLRGRRCRSRPGLRRGRRRAMVAATRVRAAALGRLRRAHQPRVPPRAGRTPTRQGCVASAGRSAVLPSGHLLRAAPRRARDLLPGRLRPPIAKSDPIDGARRASHRGG